MPLTQHPSSPSSSAQHQHEVRRIAYDRAVSVLKGAPRAVQSGAEARERLQFISQSLSDKIDEFLATGRIQKERDLCDTEYFRAMRSMTEVHGIGATKAHGAS